MAVPTRTTGLTYADLQELPEDDVRRELIGGELLVSPSPNLRHQRVALELGALFLGWVKQHGGAVFASPVDLVITESDVLQPDVTFVRPEGVGALGERHIPVPPDLVIEVSSPSTRRRDLGAKRDLYERFGVGEFWFADLDADRFEVYPLGEDGRYGKPVLYGRGDVIEPAAAPGLVVDVDEVLGPPPGA